MTQQTPAHWYRDPFGRHELRYWDGGQWTHHVASPGFQGIDPPISGPTMPTVSRPPMPTVSPVNKKIQRDVRLAGVDTANQAGGGTIFTEPVLVVSQKAKLFEVKAEYAVYNQHGQRIGSVREVGQNFMKKAMAVRAEENRTRRLQVVDTHGRVLMAITRPAKLVRSKVMVRDASGAEIGEIVQKNFGFIGKVRFGLESGRKPVGSINCEDWNAWDFNIQDATGSEVARITKTWAGMAKEMFTKGDKYVVQIHRPLEDPLRSLVIASALAVDTALRQA